MSSARTRRARDPGLPANPPPDPMPELAASHTSLEHGDRLVNQTLPGRARKPGRVPPAQRHPDSLQPGNAAPIRKRRDSASAGTVAPTSSGRAARTKRSARETHRNALERSFDPPSDGIDAGRMSLAAGRHPLGSGIRSRVHRGVRHALFRGHASVTAGTIEVARDAAPASAFQAISRSFPFSNIRPQRFEGRADRIRPAAAAGRRGPHEVRQCPTRC